MKNMGMTDRIVRAIVGIGLFLLPFLVGAWPGHISALDSTVPGGVLPSTIRIL